MLQTLLGQFGKSAVIAAGLGFGLFEGLRAFRGEQQAEFSRIPALEAELQTLRLAVSQISLKVEGVESRTANSITRRQLDAALDEALGGAESRIQGSFEAQARSVEALRLMVSQTDELLQRVLEGLESMKEESLGERVSL